MTWVAVCLGCAVERDDTEDHGASYGGAPGAGNPGGSGGVPGGSDGDGQNKLDLGQPGGDGGNGEGGTAPCVQDVDIVFVMDVSTSMGPFLSKLADEILIVDQALVAFDLPNEPRYGLVVFVDDTALLNNGAAYPDAQTLRQDFTMWSQFTASNEQVAGGNPNTTWPENTIDALHAAATGFDWRPAGETARIVIHTTDDTFWQGPAVQNNVQIQHDYSEAVTALQEQEIRVFSYAAHIGGQCDCEDVTAGFFGPYMGKSAIPEATGGGVQDINDVLVGTVSLSGGISDAVEQSICEPYPPVG